jgi:hypothetical protein
MCWLEKEPKEFSAYLFHLFRFRPFVFHLPLFSPVLALPVCFRLKAFSVAAQGKQTKG